MIFRETTDYSDTDYHVPMHDYLLMDATRMVAFRRNGDYEWQKFSKPIRFDKKGRKFEKLNEDLPTEFVFPNWIHHERVDTNNALEAFMQ